MSVRSAVLQLKLGDMPIGSDPKPPTATLKDLGIVLHANNVESELPAHRAMARLAWMNCKTACHVSAARVVLLLPGAPATSAQSTSQVPFPSVSRRAVNAYQSAVDCRWAVMPSVASDEL